jgi:hypothetical protein
MGKTFIRYLIFFLASILLYNCSSTSNIKWLENDYSLGNINEGESVVIGTLERQGYVKAVNLYGISGKLIESFSFDNGQSKTDLEIIMKPGQYYLMVIYSDNCNMKGLWSISTETDSYGKSISDKAWHSPPDKFLEFDVPHSSLVNLGTFKARIETKSDRSYDGRSLTVCNFQLQHEEGGVIEKFKSSYPKIYENFKDKVVTINEK